MDTSSTVFKALDTLTILSGQENGLLTPDLAIALNQPRTNVLRIVRTLQRYGLVTCDGRRWVATTAFRDWSAPPSRHIVLRNRYATVLDAVAAETGELTILGLHEGNGILHIDHRMSADGLRPTATRGIRHALRNSAFGKLALSRRPDLAARISDPALTSELETVREHGVAWMRDDTSHGTVVMAFPGFFNQPTEPMISVTWPKKRFSEVAAENARRAARHATDAAMNPLSVSSSIRAS